jgi:flagellar biosynthesis/type III secretory pathway M-ring protein FliF/YscJ
MEKFETIARIAEWLALPLSYFILLVLFLFFIVRPFFSHIFNLDRINALRILQKAQKEMEMAQQADAARDEQGAAGDDQAAEPVPGNRDEQQLMSRLAESDPEKAGSLVKQWLRKDQS